LKEIVELDDVNVFGRPHNGLVAKLCSSARAKSRFNRAPRAPNSAIKIPILEGNVD